MKNSIKNLLFTLIALCTFSINAYANDGEFHVSGNHLIPISSTDIKIAKETLTIKINDSTGHTFVDVDYTFVNTSSKPKKVKMGFEASPLEDEWDAILPDEGQEGHPFIYDFKVEMNGENVNYTNEFAFCDSSLVCDYKHFPVDKSKWIHGGDEYKAREESTYWDYGLWNKNTNEVRAFSYVYFFEVTFQPGENKIHHTYRYDSGNGQLNAYTITYWLSPAMRWSGSKIEDFTLKIIGKDTDHFVLEGPFSDGEYQFTKGKGKHRRTDYGEEIIMIDGELEFHSKDFVPKYNMTIRSYDNYIFNTDYYSNGGKITHGINDYFKSGLFFKCIDYFTEFDFSSCTDWEKRIARNMPYASRGYIFKDKKLAEFFNQQFWYMPDPTWFPSQEDFSEWEINIINRASQK